ncbi:MAG TPA: DnaJ domain-containing protein [Kofleriaceae bacterium]
MRGSISDRPWGGTLSAIALGGRSGQLDLTSAGNQRFSIAFVHGHVVGATSPLPVDSVARVALANRMIPAMIAKAYAKIDDVDRFADAVKLTAPQAHHLKRRVLLQRVARTFSIDVGKYVLDERISIPVMLGIEVDIRAAVYMGMRMNLSQQRLTRTLHRIGGARFQLVTDAINTLAKFELGDDEQIVIDALHNGTSIPELQAAHHDLDPRMIEALLCALVVCDAAVQTDVAGRTPTPRDPTFTPPQGLSVSKVEYVPVSRTMSDLAVPIQQAPHRAPRVDDTADASAVPMLIRRDPDVVIPRTASRLPTEPRVLTKKVDKRTAPVSTVQLAELVQQTRKQTPVAGRSYTDPFLEAQPTKARPPALDHDEVHELIEVGVMLLEQGVDHFSYLGLSYDAPVDEVREAYVEFARYLRPERLREMGIEGHEAQEANAVFAKVVIAYTVLTDPTRRRTYLAELDATRARARR